MKKHHLIIIFILCSILVVSRVKTATFGERVWLQTTQEDFLRGTGQDAVVTNVAGGEVCLRHPLVKVVQDHEDKSVPRFISRDHWGRYVKIWTTDNNLYAQRYDANGDSLGITFQVNDVDSSVSGYRGDQVVAMADSGNFLIAWIDTRTPRGVYAQIYDSDAVPIGANFRVNGTTTEFFFFYLSVAAFVTREQDYWVVWSEGSLFEGSDVYGQHYTKNGERIGGNVKLSEDRPAVRINLKACTDTSGRFAVIWRQGEIGVGYEQQMYARLFDQNGQALSPPLPLSEQPASIDPLLRCRL